MSVYVVRFSPFFLPLVTKRTAYANVQVQITSDATQTVTLGGVGVDKDIWDLYSRGSNSPPDER